MSETKAKKPVISQERMYQLIVSPVITEKATVLTEVGQVTFKVMAGGTFVVKESCPDGE